MRRTALSDTARTVLSRWPALAALLALALGARIVVTTLGFVWRCYFVGPFDDFWHFIGLLIDYEGGASAFELWVARFGAHRILVGKLFS